DFARSRLVQRAHSTEAFHAAWLRARAAEQGKRKQRNDTNSEPVEKSTNGTPVALPTITSQHGLSNTHSRVVGQRTFTFGKTACNVASDCLHERRHLVGLCQHRAAITCVLDEAVLPLVAAHLDMRHHVNP